jgi:cytochrome P450
MGEAVFTLHQFASGLAEERQRDPQDDLMTALVQAELDGERMTIPEIAAFFVLLSVAGNDTTRHTTSHALHALTAHPDQRARLQADRSLMPGAIEEFVRWATPVMNFRRTTTREVEMHGTTIPAGQKVILFYTSGNRDERAFEDPWEFDITRSPNHHLGYGGGGPHYCLGASLARTQLDAIFSELFDQIPDIEAGELELYEGGSFIHGVKRLPAEWTPTG